MLLITKDADSHPVSYIVSGHHINTYQTPGANSLLIYFYGRSQRPVSIPYWIPGNKV
jgi:hypothetical protein